MWLKLHQDGMPGGKLDLAKTSDGMQKLKMILEAAFPEQGSREVWQSERNTWLAENGQPLCYTQRTDLQGFHHRVHYLKDFQRRLNLNEASQAEMQDRLPGIGPAKAENLYTAIQVKKEDGESITCIKDLENLRVQQVGPATLKKLEPFVCFD